jgi:hypothetical protein
MSDHYDVSPGLTCERGGDDIRVVLEGRSRIIAGEIHRHDVMTPRLELRNDPLPTPRPMPAAVHQSEQSD